MSYYNWEDFWWTEITGASSVVKRVATALLENKMVVLRVPSDLPWRRAMRASIQAMFQEQTDERNIIIQQVDMKDDNPDNENPGKFILQYFATIDVRTGYREKSKLSLQEYIAKHGILKNRIVWVKGIRGDSADKWIEFCEEFPHKTESDGLFVLEIQGNTCEIDQRIFTYVNYDEAVSSYDVQLFNTFILDNEAGDNYSDLWKRYIATLAATICGVDAEISERFLQSLDFRTESPIEGLKRIAENREYERRGTGQDSRHILKYYRNGNMAEIERRIWIAQVQVLFPLIEIERTEFIEKYESQISDALQNNNVTQFNELLTDPKDVELGTWCQMMDPRNRKVPDLQGIEYADEQRILFLRDCRNSLAHASSCSPEQVTQLIDQHRDP